MLKKYMRFVLCAILGLFFSSLVFSQQDTSIVHGPFKTSLYAEGEFYFEKTTDFEYPINFVLKYKSNKKIQSYIIDKYSHNGGIPEVLSLFFYKSGDTSYIFTIVMWNINHRGIGTYGQFYQVYGYHKNREGILIKDTRFEYDNNLSGIDGIDDNHESYFKYKTAAEVKKYINETYNLKQVN